MVTTPCIVNKPEPEINLSSQYINTAAAFNMSTIGGWMVAVDGQKTDYFSYLFFLQYNMTCLKVPHWSHFMPIWVLKETFVWNMASHFTPHESHSGLCGCVATLCRAGPSHVLRILTVILCPLTGVLPPLTNLLYNLISSSWQEDLVVVVMLVLPVSKQ